jgi:acetyltransferase-like isoleucine patch superfamily enzyme
MKNVSGIHPTALIGDGVAMGKDVVIGPRAIIYDNVTLGDGCQIGADVILGEPLADIYRDAANYVNPTLVIGANSIIRSGSIIYAGSQFGERFETGHRVTIREGTVAGENLRVGTLSDIQGDCVIGDYVRFHSNVHIGQKSVVGNYVWIFPYVVLTNDPHPPSTFLVGVTVGDFSVIATMSVVLPGVTIGKDALIGAGSIVNRDVGDEDVVVGNPAKKVATVREIKSKNDRSAVYPWREHFGRGMPWEDVGYEAWNATR